MNGRHFRRIQQLLVTVVAALLLKGVTGVQWRGSEKRLERKQMMMLG
jgi:hypothetical protein